MNTIPSPKIDKKYLEFETIPYDKTVYKRQVDDLNSKQEELIVSINEIKSSSKKDRKINIAILVLTSIGTICSIAAIIISLIFNP